MLKEGKRISDIVSDEVNQNLSREEVTVAQGSNLSIGTIVGKITKALDTATKTGSGGGTIDSITLGVDAKIGEYKAICTTTSTNGGVFTVYAPTNEIIGFATVGSAFTSSHINFTISDGNPDFASGDTFTIPVVSGSGKVVAATLDGVNGSQDAYGVILSDVNATVDTQAVAVVRLARLKLNNLIFPANATAAQKNKLLNDLKAKMIIASTAI